MTEERTPAPHWALDCAHYRGEGPCTGRALCSIYNEPRCITETPLNGWRRRDLRGRFLPKERNQ